MNEQIAWMALFPVVVPILFAVVKLAWDERRRHEDVCRRLSHIEKNLAEQNHLLEQVSSRR